jgi:hypothetical protein
MFWEKALKKRNKSEKGSKTKNFPAERYTIFHALFEVLKEKDKKHKNRN